MERTRTIEIFDRMRRVETENAAQTVLLQSLDANVTKLAEQSEKTAAAYQIGRGILLALGGMATFVFALPSLIDLFHRLTTQGGK